MIAHAGLAALLALPAAILLLPQWTPLPASWFTAPALEPQATGGSAIDPATATASVPVMLDAAGSTPIISDWHGLAPFLSLVPLVLLCGVMMLAVVRLLATRGQIGRARCGGRVWRYGEISVVA